MNEFIQTSGSISIQYTDSCQMETKKNCTYEANSGNTITPSSSMKIDMSNRRIFKYYES